MRPDQDSLPLKHNPLVTYGGFSNSRIFGPFVRTEPEIYWMPHFPGGRPLREFDLGHE
jgi:hypothetical protein